MKQQYNTALYLRLSRDDELKGESGSISTQRTMLTQYCKEQKMRIVGEYVDDGWSGTNFDRPSFQRMIDDIEDGKINCVITKDLSKLGRNYILTGQYTEIYFLSKGVRYIALNDNVEEYAKITLLFLWDSCCYTLYAPYSRTIMQADLICFRDCQTMRCFAH